MCENFETRKKKIFPDSFQALVCLLVNKLLMTNQHLIQIELSNSYKMSQIEVFKKDCVAICIITDIFI